MFKIIFKVTKFNNFANWLFENKNIRSKIHTQIHFMRFLLSFFRIIFITNLSLVKSMAILFIMGYVSHLSLTFKNIFPFNLKNNKANSLIGIPLCTP